MGSSARRELSLPETLECVPARVDKTELDRQNSLTQYKEALYIQIYRENIWYAVCCEVQSMLSNMDYALLTTGLVQTRSLSSII